MKAERKLISKKQTERVLHAILPFHGDRGKGLGGSGNWGSLGGPIWDSEEKFRGKKWWPQRIAASPSGYKFGAI